MMRSETQLAIDGFEDRQGPQAKESRKAIEAGKEPKQILP
jgi:hypothetical protein